MNIRAQIVTGLTIVVAVFAVTSWLSGRAVNDQRPLLSEISARTNTVSSYSIKLFGAIKDMNLQVAQLQQFLSDISATRGQDGLDDGFDKAAAAAQDFAAASAQAHSAARALDLKTIDGAITDAERAFSPYYETGRKMAEAYIADGAPGGNKLMPQFDQTAELMHQNLDQVAELIEQETTNALTGLNEAAQRVEASNHRVSTTLTIAGAIGLALAAMVGVALAWQLSRLFRLLAQDVDAVLAERHDQPLNLHHDRKDEFGPIAHALAQFRANARRILAMQAEQAAQAQQAESARRQALLDMADTVEVETAEAVDNVARETIQMRDLATDMAHSAQQVGENSQGVAAAAEQALRNAQAVAGAAEELSASIREIGSQATLSTQVVSGIVHSARESAETVHQLSDAMARIGDVAKLINAIAEQTNMLSLNATIEAARAGEAGKGFAVVAHEVKGLATQTARSTEEISREVTALQTIGRQVAQAIAGITGSIEEISGITNSIAAAVEEQDAATLEIVRNVVQTSHAAEEVAQRIASVASDAQSTGQSADLVQHQLESISVRVRELKSNLNEVVRTAAPEVDRRHNPRIALGQSVEIQIGDATIAARMADLSRCGSRMFAVPSLLGGDRGIVRIPGLPGALAFQVIERLDGGMRVRFDDSSPEAAKLATFITQHDHHQPKAA
ncbi:methyl-accepting chemotaxis protein [Magnetospirillum sulfuroxidans]|uniref:PilZ domain-containing protein n=1 Tax=Magnetospirillum sulfuroxidans TaxID=611300 RepID=A0ABS5IEY1_9PROT|nr:methyl-accepting chemotaxis protein [Magnetospirillum sulfuroxidans]MBR9972288.1 PilZ domain-containing protein [Magnetospirillum sulfuroxidans]